MSDPAISALLERTSLIPLETLTEIVGVKPKTLVDKHYRGKCPRLVRRGNNYFCHQDDATSYLKNGARDLTILIVHHTRKATGDSDVMDEVSGTLGLNGGVDGTLVLKRGRGEDEAELHLSGRDLETEGEFGARFNRETCHWEWVGDAWQVRIGDERREIIDTILNAPGKAMKPAEIAVAMNKNQGATRKLIKGMTDAGQLDRGMDGQYRVLERSVGNGGNVGDTPALGNNGNAVTH